MGGLGFNGATSVWKWIAKKAQTEGKADNKVSMEPLPSGNG